MLRDVTHTVSDGLLNTAANTGTGHHVKIGVSPVVADTPIVITGQMTAAKIKELLGLSPLADAVMDSVDNGSNKIYCIPVAASTAGTNSEVVKTGDGTGTMAVSGSPNNAFSVIAKITLQGELNTAAFVISIDGGYSYSDEVTIPTSGSYEIQGTGLTIKFAGADGTPFHAGDTFAFTSTAPTMTTADVTAAVDRLKRFSEPFEFVHLVGGTTVAVWQLISTAQAELSTVYHKPLFFLLEAAGANQAESLSEYVTRLEKERKQIRNYNVQVVPVRGLYVKMDGTTQEVNLAGVVAGLYSRTAVHVSIGKTSKEAALGISKYKLLALRPSGIEDHIETLDLAGYLTFRSYDGLDNIYVYHAFMLSPEVSDYKYAEDVRVLNKIIRETRKTALLVLNDDIDFSDVQGELKTRAAFMFAPLQTMIDSKEISAAEIMIPDDQQADFIATGKMRVVIRYIARGYIREIEIDLGRKQPD